MQKMYDEINFVNPSEIIAGHNGQDKYGKVQEAVAVLVNRRLGRLVINHPFLSGDNRVFYPVERLIIDQYENVYYMMHCVLADGDVHTFCDRVRTFKEKKNYELDKGWDYVFWKYRNLGFEAIRDAQLSAIARSN